MTKTERLQAIWDSAPDFWEASIEYRKNKGWFVDFIESRHFNDQPEFIGRRYREAKAYLLKLVNA